MLKAVQERRKSLSHCSFFYCRIAWSSAVWANPIMVCAVSTKTAVARAIIYNFLNFIFSFRLPGHANLPYLCKNSSSPYQYDLFHRNIHTDLYKDYDSLAFQLLSSAEVRMRYIHSFNFLII